MLALFRALILLYENSNQPEKGLEISIRLKDVGAFDLLRRHLLPQDQTAGRFRTVARRQIISLCQIDTIQAISLMIDCIQELPVSIPLTISLPVRLLKLPEVSYRAVLFWILGRVCRTGAGVSTPAAFQGKFCPIKSIPQLPIMPFCINSILKCYIYEIQGRLCHISIGWWSCMLPTVVSNFCPSCALLISIRSMRLLSCVNPSTTSPRQCISLLGLDVARMLFGYSWKRFSVEFSLEYSPIGCLFVASSA